MKKIIIIGTIIFVLTACGQAEVQNKIYKQLEKTQPETNEPKSTQSLSEETEIFKYDGTTQIVNMNEGNKFNFFTELSGQIGKFYNEEGACKGIASTNYLGQQGTPPEIYEDQFKVEFKDLIKEDEMDAFIEQARKTMSENNTIILSHLCKGDDGNYLAFWDRDNLYISFWDGDKFKTQKTIGVGHTDYSFYFVPNFFGKNHLIGSGSGDAGLITWWFAELNFETEERTTIEKCSASTRFDGNNGFTNKIDVLCDVEYSSENGVIYYDEYQFRQCEDMVGAEKDNCLLSLAEYDFHKYGNSKIDPNKICSLILNEDERNQCFWGYAMKLKSTELCKLMPEKVERGKEYGGKSSCKSELSYETENSKWALDSGIPLSKQDVNSVHYKGSAELAGWVIAKEKSNYNELVFHVADEDLDKLPPMAQKYQDFNFTVWSGKRNEMKINNREDLPEWLDLTEENPGKINPADIIVSDDYQQIWIRDY